jgi:hypothetical protein
MDCVNDIIHRILNTETILLKNELYGPIVFQCMYCHLPEHPPEARISHGACDSCLETEHPELKEETK